MQSGSDGGAALGGDPGPLEARADDSVLGRAQQSVLGDKTKGARLSQLGISNCHALLRRRQVGDTPLLVLIINVEEAEFLILDWVGLRGGAQGVVVAESSNLTLNWSRGSPENSDSVAAVTVRYPYSDRRAFAYSSQLVESGWLANLVEL